MIQRLIFGIFLMLPILAFPSVSTITAETLLARLAQNDNLVILDVRTPDEFSQGHVPNAINISHDALKDKLDTLAPYRTTPIVVYCRSGRRAKLALKILEEAGFKELYHLVGDMNQWKAENRPIEK